MHTHKKLTSALSCQEIFHINMANYFAYSSSCLYFDIFEVILKDPLIQILCTISGENKVILSTIPYLKKNAQDEWKFFKKHLQKEVNNHCIRLREDRFTN